MLAEWKEEGVRTDLVADRHPDRIPGLYSIRVDDRGERTLLSIGGKNRPRAPFSNVQAPMLSMQQRAETADVLYLSGITLIAVFQCGRARTDLQHLPARFARKRRRSGTRHQLPRQRAGPTRLHCKDRRSSISVAYATIVLPTLEDDQALYGDQDHDSCADRWLNAGVREVAVKLGAAGVFVASKSARELVAPNAPIAARDTTGAGDSFNAAYLAARLNGHSQVVAAKCGNHLAGCGCATSRGHHPQAADADSGSAKLAGHRRNMIRPLNNACRSATDLSGIWRIRFDPDDLGRRDHWGNGIGAEGSHAIAIPGSWNEQLAEAGYMNYVGAAWLETQLFRA